jgi:hypothetical protein
MSERQAVYATARPPAIPEAALLRAVGDLATMAGWRWYHTRFSFASGAGFPDLCLVKGGRLLFVELKGERGTISAAQRAWLDALGGTAAEVYTWNPDDWRAGRVDAVLLAGEAGPDVAAANPSFVVGSGQGRGASPTSAVAASPLGRVVERDEGSA